MTTADLKNEIALETSMTKDQAGKMIKAMVSTLIGSLSKGEKVVLVGFGSFEVRERAARTGRNPRTGEPLHIPASRNVCFKPGKNLKDSVRS